MRKKSRLKGNIRLFNEKTVNLVSKDKKRIKQVEKTDNLIKKMTTDCLTIGEDSVLR